MKGELSLIPIESWFESAAGGFKIRETLSQWCLKKIKI